jgi:hypothetical protein
MEMLQLNTLYSYCKQKCLLSKAETRKVKQVLSRGGCLWEGEGKYGGNIGYSCMKMKKMRPVESILGMGEGRDKGE